MVTESDEVEAGRVGRAQVLLKDQAMLLQVAIGKGVRMVRVMHEHDAIDAAISAGVAGGSLTSAVVATDELAPRRRQLSAAAAARHRRWLRLGVPGRFSGAPAKVCGTDLRPRLS